MRRNPYKKSRRLPVGDLGLRLPVRSELPTIEHSELDFGEAELCYMLALWSGGGHIVNLGDGASATLFALSLIDHKLPGFVSTVDSYDKPTRKRISRERLRLGVSERVQLHNMRTDHARARIEAQASLLFVDADHSYEGVRKDMELYMPLLDDGYLALHDTNQDGVDKAMKELLSGWDLVYWVNRVKVYRRA